MFRAGLPHEDKKRPGRRQVKPISRAPLIHDLNPHLWDESVFCIFLQSNELWRRERLYQQLKSMLQQNSVSASWLLHFIRWEPNFRLVQRATRDYVFYRSCNVLEEFRGVEDIVTLYEQQALTSPGAVLSGLLSIGDRRVNAVLRVLIGDLSLTDIREFTRIHEPQLTAATIEFYLNWMHRLTGKSDAEKFSLVCSKLHQMVLHDETGQVSDRNETTLVGFSGPFNTRLIPFEDYLAKIEGALLTVTGPGPTLCEQVYLPMLNAWRTHAERTKTSRADDRIWSGVS